MTVIQPCFKVHGRKIEKRLARRASMRLARQSRLKGSRKIEKRLACDCDCDPVLRRGPADARGPLAHARLSACRRARLGALALSDTEPGMAELEAARLAGHPPYCARLEKSDVKYWRVIRPTARGLRKVT